MPQFFTRPSFAQPQPQVAQLPFSQFGGQRGPLPTDTTGGIAFPDAGISTPTGLSPQELQALVGERFERFGDSRVNNVLSRLTNQVGFRNEFPEAMMGAFNASQALLSGATSGTPSLGPGGQFLTAQGGAFPFNPASPTTQTQSSLPLGGIPFEGGGSVDKFNPTLNTGAPLPTTTTATPTTINPFNRNFFGGL